MSTQGSSGIEIVDLTEDELPDFRAPASPSPPDMAGSQEMRDAGVSAGEEALDIGSSSDIEEVIMENAVIDAETRQRNLDGRRERLSRRIREGVAPNVQDLADVEEVIVISDDDAEEDRFAVQRRNRRRQRIWEDEPEPVRHQGADSIETTPALSPGPANPPLQWQNMDAFFGEGPIFQALEHTPPPRVRLGSPPPLPFEGDIRRNLLGGGGIFGRNRPMPHQVYHPPRPNMHRRSLELDAQRLPGRARAHLNGLMEDQNEAGFLDLLGGALGGAFGRIGDALGLRGGGGWGVPDVIVRRGDPPAEFGGGGWEEREIDLPEAPDYQTSFTHPGKMPKGFTNEFAPVKPDLINIEDSDNDEFDPLFDDMYVRPPKKSRRKNKGKSRAHPLPPLGLGLASIDAEPDASLNKANSLTVVCAACDDPLVIGLNSDVTEDQKIYGLLCGHVIDGKCLWKLAIPPPPTDEMAVEQQLSVPSKPSNKGKGRAIPDEEGNWIAAPDQTQSILEPFPFTFTHPLPPKPAFNPLFDNSDQPGTQSPQLALSNPSLGTMNAAQQNESGTTNIPGVYEEDNSPRAAPVPSTIRSRLRSHREIVPTPHSYAGRRRKRGADKDGLDQLDDNYNPVLNSGANGVVYSGPPGLDLSDPFLPRLASTSTWAPTMPIAPAGRGRRKGANTSKKSKLKFRYVKKKKQREEMHEWTCPVEGCGKVHLSVRWDIEGAKWRCDEEKGAKLMFL